jgi:hypothetical protein
MTSDILKEAARAVAYTAAITAFAGLVTAILGTAAGILLAGLAAQ